MKIGVVSDTHGHRANTLQAIWMLSGRGIEAVLHCGDIVGADLIPLFAEWPTHFVFGNCDDDPAGLRFTIQDAGQFCHERFGDIELGGRRIALLHGDDGRRLHAAVTGGDYDLVCSGHTHIPKQHRVGSNPQFSGQSAPASQQASHPPEHDCHAKTSSAFCQALWSMVVDLRSVHGVVGQV